MKKIKGMEVVVLEDEKQRILESVSHICDTGYFMWGDYQEALCEKFKELTGKEHAVTFNSCTAALEVLFKWLGSGNTVCLQANAFPSPAYAAVRAGSVVTWSDIDEDEMTPGIADLNTAYERDKFATVVLQWTGGYVPSYIDVLRSWCDTRKVHFIEDASHSAGSAVGPNKAGSWGDTAVFSLAATKPLQTGQGGVLLTNDVHLARFCFMMKNYGRTEMFQKGEYLHAGYNMHMTEIQAAIGLVMFEGMEGRIAKRYQVLDRMVESGPKTSRLLGNWRNARPNLYKVVFRIAHERKDALKAHLAAANIELGSSIYDFVTPLLPVFGGLFDKLKFPQCARFAKEHVCLPMHDALTLEDGEYVGRRLKEFFDS